MTHVLIVEDEASIADTLLFALQAEGFSTTWMQLAGAAIEHVRSQQTDLIILDVGLPDINGFEACKQIRRFSQVPILFLTARGSEIDRIVGLEIGADDYVVKPFSPREVAARVRVILKRTMQVSSMPASTLASTPASVFQIDLNKCQISYRQQPLDLTRHEFHMLQCLVTQPGKVLSREQLLIATGVTAEAGYERNIDSHIKSLRAKLRVIAPEHEPIQTHRGFGYSYDSEHS